MPEEKDALLAHYRQMREELLSAIDGLSDALMTETSIDGWSVKDHLAHVAFWDDVNSWIDIRLRSLTDQKVTIPALEMEIDFAESEEMRTEISSKFTREQLEALYGEAGLELVELWTDPESQFALSLARAA